jgi:predicted nucleic acid-binding protein
VIDASTGIFEVIDNPLNKQVDLLWKEWAQQGFQVYVPQLWLNEVTSVLHKVLMQKLISEEKALLALDAVLALGVTVKPESSQDCRRAFNWATRLGQFAANDCFYLALAEEMGIEFWTADERLANRAKQLGVNWVRWIGEGKS